MFIQKSAYNLLFKINDGFTILYNTFSGSALRVSSSFADYFENKFYDSSKYPEKITTILLDNGFLLKKNIVELQEIERLHKESFKRFDELFLFIILTMDCNFSCPYCYQRVSRQTLNSESVQKILNFINTYSIDHGVTKVNINWFGGEPLLNKKAIYEISKAIQANGLKLTATLNTNGYLLDEAFVSDLALLGISDIKITIDGVESTHDSRRFTKNGDGSFTTIKSNIKKVIELYDSKIDIQISSNIDIENMYNYCDFLNSMKDFRNKVVFSIERTRNTMGRGSNYEKSIPQESFNIISEQIYKTIRDKGFGEVNMPKRINVSCHAELKNSFTFGSDGSVYKCASGINIPKNKLGHLDDEGKIIFNTEILKKWSNIDVFKDEECVKCVLLPLCMGGCPEKRVGLNPGALVKRSCYYEKNMEVIKNRVLFCCSDADSVDTKKA